MKPETIRERITRLCQEDETNIRDAEVFRAKWGEYPPGWTRKRGGRRLLDHKPTSFIEHPDKLMTARNEFHQGAALWRYSVGSWACVQADDCLSFLLHKSEAECHLELTKRGFKWEWSNPPLS